MGRERDKHGRFVKGNKGGPGRPKKPPAEYLSVVPEEVSLDEWRAIIKQAVEAAKDGDSRARDFVTRLLFDAAELEAKIENESIWRILRGGADESDRRKEAEKHVA